MFNSTEFNESSTKFNKGVEVNLNKDQITDYDRMIEQSKKSVISNIATELFMRYPYDSPQKLWELAEGWQAFLATKLAKNTTTGNVEGSVTYAEMDKIIGTI